MAKFPAKATPNHIGRRRGAADLDPGHVHTYADFVASVIEPAMAARLVSVRGADPARASPPASVQS